MFVGWLAINSLVIDSADAVLMFHDENNQFSIQTLCSNKNTHTHTIQKKNGEYKSSAIPNINKHITSNDRFIHYASLLQLHRFHLEIC